jgi:hypothetical protein
VDSPSHPATFDAIERSRLGFGFLLRAGDIAETCDESETDKQ